MSDDRTPLVEVKVWDLPIRVFHWWFTLMFAVSWISGWIGDRDRHYVSGMILLGLVVFRILYGLVGSPTARFSHFVRWPGAGFRYLRGAFAHRTPSHTYGHNAAGGLMVLALVVLIGLQTVSGMASTDDILFEGPLYGRVPDWLARILEPLHEPLAKVLLALASLHVLVILVYWLWKRENLVRAMIVGRARLPRTVGVQEKSTPWGRALICAAIAAAVPTAIHLKLMS